MPYRFKIDEPVEKGFRRIAREQLDIAFTELAPPAPNILPTGVHECRKALKRMRALVRLATPALGQRKARRRARALSEIARLLSARRDQAVMLETLAKLTSDSNSDAAATLAPLRAHLVGVVGEEPKPLDADCAAKARLMLLREAKKFAHTRFRKRGFAALEGGLEKSYRRARNAMKNAYGEPSDESFHTMRKAVQWHWRQMSLLGRAWPDEFAVRVTAARELSQMLGDDHDLAMLIDVDGARRRHIRRGQGSHRRVMSASPTCVAQRRRTPRRAAFRRDAGGVHKAHGRVLALWPDCRSGPECLAGRARRSAKTAGSGQTRNSTRCRSGKGCFDKAPACGESSRIGPIATPRLIR